MSRVQSPPAPPTTRYDSGMTTEKQKPGPEADRLKLEGDWKDRLSQAIAKKRPKGGWPKPKKKRDQKKQANASS